MPMRSVAEPDATGPMCRAHRAVATNRSTKHKMNARGTDRIEAVPPGRSLILILLLLLRGRNVVHKHVTVGHGVRVHAALLHDLDLQCTVSCVVPAARCASAMTADSNVGL